MNNKNEKIQITQDDRVGVFQNQSLTVFLGWGYHLGCYKRPKGIGAQLASLYQSFGLSEEEIKSLGDNPNPKIVLENGKVIWGCEIYWTDEETTKLALKVNGDNLERMTVEELREEYYAFLPVEKRPELEIIEFEVKK